MSRVEDLEARIAELQTELDGLLDEYMDTRRRLHELEAIQAPESADPGPLARGDDPHAVVVHSARDRSATAGSTTATATTPRTATTGGPATDAGVNGGSDANQHEASQKEVDEAVRRVEGNDADGGTDADTDGSEPERADDIIVG